MSLKPKKEYKQDLDEFMVEHKFIKGQKVIIMATTTQLKKNVGVECFKPKQKVIIERQNGFGGFDAFHKNEPTYLIQGFHFPEIYLKKLNDTQPNNQPPLPKEPKNLLK